LLKHKLLQKRTADGLKSQLLDLIDTVGVSAPIDSALENLDFEAELDDPEATLPRHLQSLPTQQYVAGAAVELLLPDVKTASENECDVVKPGKVASKKKYTAGMVV